MTDDTTPKTTADEREIGEIAGRDCRTEVAWFCLYPDCDCPQAGVKTNVALPPPPLPDVWHSGMGPRLTWLQSRLNNLRWRLALWLLYRGLGVAPDGRAALDLEDGFRNWAMKWRMF